MIDWKNKPEGAQRRLDTGHESWLKQVEGVVHFYAVDEWVGYDSAIVALRNWNNATAIPQPLQLTWNNAADQATHILQHIDGRQVFAIELINGEFRDFSDQYSIYDMLHWSVLSERPVNQEHSQTTVDSTINERGERYGKFNEGADIMQTLKNVMRKTDGWERLTSSQREALEMIQHKIGRVLNGDPTYDDNWRDICGYSQLILDELNGNKR